MLRTLNYSINKTGAGADSKVTLEVTCPMCGGTQSVEMSEEQYAAVESGALCIQDALPYHNAFDRETLISGMCHDCQSKMFNRPKPGEDWGPVIGECDCCGARIYEKDKGKCSQCGCPFTTCCEDDEGV